MEFEGAWPATVCKRPGAVWHPWSHPNYQCHNNQPNASGQNLLTKGRRRLMNDHEECFLWFYHLNGFGQRLASASSKAVRCPDIFQHSRGGKKSLFDLLEDLDATACLKKCTSAILSQLEARHFLGDKNTSQKDRLRKSFKCHFYMESTNKKKCRNHT